MAGANYGWPTCEGPNRDLHRGPVRCRLRRVRSTPTIVERPPECAIIGGTFYNPQIEQYPAAFAQRVLLRRSVCRVDPPDRSGHGSRVGLRHRHLEPGRLTGVERRQPLLSDARRSRLSDQLLRDGESARPGRHGRLRRQRDGRPRGVSTVGPAPGACAISSTSSSATGRHSGARRLQRRRHDRRGGLPAVDRRVVRAQSVRGAVRRARRRAGAGRLQRRRHRPTSPCTGRRPASGTCATSSRSSSASAATVPVPADYNGDGVDRRRRVSGDHRDVVVLGQTPVQLGNPGRLPVPGDYDGDGVGRPRGLPADRAGSGTSQDQPSVSVRPAPATCPCRATTTATASPTSRSIGPRPGSGSCAASSSCSSATPGDVAVPRGPSPARAHRRRLRRRRGDATSPCIGRRRLRGSFATGSRCSSAMRAIARCPPTTTATAIDRRRGVPAVDRRWFVRNQFAVRVRRPGRHPCARRLQRRRARPTSPCLPSVDRHVVRPRISSSRAVRRSRATFPSRATTTATASPTSRSTVRRPASGSCATCSDRAVRRQRRSSRSPATTTATARRHRGVSSVDRRVVRAQSVRGRAVRRAGRHAGCRRLQRRRPRRTWRSIVRRPDSGSSVISSSCSSGIQGMCRSCASAAELAGPRQRRLRSQRRSHTEKRSQRSNGDSLVVCESP